MCGDVFHNLIGSLSFNSPFHGLVNSVDLRLDLFCILLCFLKPNKLLVALRVYKQICSRASVRGDIFTDYQVDQARKKTLHKKHLLSHSMFYICFLLFLIIVSSHYPHYLLASHFVKYSCTSYMYIIIFNLSIFRNSRSL